MAFFLKNRICRCGFCKNGILYISTPSAKTSILAAADIIIEKIHIVYMSTPSARTPLVARVVFWLMARICIIRRTQLDARMACNVHANAARPVSIEENASQPCSSEQVSGLIQADVTPQHSPMAREFMGNSRSWLRGIHGNSWEFMGIHARILY